MSPKNRIWHSTPVALTPGQPLVLNGDPMFRGRCQSTAEPQMRAAVFRAVSDRLDCARQALYEVAGYLAKQWDFTCQHAPGQVLQIRGLAEGYGIEPRDLFAYLHLGVIEDAAGKVLTEEEGCTVVACQLLDAGPVLGKNRDYRGDHRALQRVFLETDPAWGERRILTVGSLGSPGAFSSGMNSDGLALADTRIGWPHPGVGWLRYLLMNEILVRAGTLAQALDLIGSQPHVGGGSLVLMDADGNAASVELGPEKIHVTRAGPTGIGHTNHFLSLEPNNSPGRVVMGNNAEIVNSRGRQARIDGWLASSPENHSLAGAAALFAAHQVDDAPALCLHDSGETSKTISTALFACAARRLYFCAGNPCVDDWRIYSF